MPAARARTTARRALDDLLGHDRPLPGQVDAIAAVLEGRDTLALLPTGGGKSSIYQVAAALIDGPTVVVSPLVALQQDQRRALDAAEVGEAVVANASIGDRARREALEAVAAGEAEFLLLAPEQLRRPDTLEGLRAARPSLFVVDEAHCVSAWGYDFRPDYLRLAPVIEELGHPVVLALTATAAPPVRAEIAEVLGLRDPAVVAAGFDRPEIDLTVEQVADADDKRAAVLARALDEPGPGIVYVATRRDAEEVAEALVAAGARAAAYHAGLPPSVRQEVLDGFVGATIDVVAATTAFGLGIDKADVRFVLHHDPAESLDAYYQEIGRAGRDGQPAAAVLFWRSEDLARRGSLAQVGELDAEEVADLLAAVASGATTSEEVAGALDARPGHVEHLVNLLVAAGGLELGADGGIERTGRPEARVVAEVLASVEARRSLVRSRLEMVRTYAESRSCRRAVLLAYFGEHLDAPCGACDRCRAGEGDPVEEPIAAVVERFPVGAAVRHREWGEGTVVRHDGADRFTVLFDDVGYKLIAGSIVLDGGLLEPIDG